MVSIETVHTLPTNEQLEAYTQIINNASSQEELRSLITRILSVENQLSLLIARPVVNVLIARISESEYLLAFALEAITPRTSTFEEQVVHIREALATRLELQHDFLEAARTLQGISLESGQRVIGDDYKLKVYIRIIRCFLEEDDATSADTYLNRATLLIHSTQDPEILLHFKLAQARIFDSRRKFIEASQKYHELSFSAQIPEEERVACLSAAITCGVLAPAGPSRTRWLSTLYKDDRSRSLDNYKILENMFLDRLIAPKQVDEFAKTLKAHQLALLPDGTTVLSRAVIEHNLLSASKLYDNIGITELGELLDLDPAAAEKFARGMIESKRLSGEMDQVSGIIDFTGDGPVTEEDTAGQETARWDRGIESLLVQVEECASLIEKKYPAWVASLS